MTLTLALRTALTGLSATQTALQAASSNITNVNTEGYSRKDVTFSTNNLDGTGAGVNVATIDRVVDEFLIREIRDQQAIIGNLDVREKFLGQLESLFASPDNNRSITTGLDAVRDALEAFSVTPESSAAACRPESLSNNKLYSYPIFLLCISSLRLSPLWRFRFPLRIFSIRFFISAGIAPWNRLIFLGFAPLSEISVSTTSVMVEG